MSQMQDMFTSVEIKLSELLQNSKNPRVIKDKGYKQLERSLKNNGLVPNSIIIDSDNTIISGNQRARIALDLFGDISVKVMKANKKLTKKQVEALTVVMNVSSGEWNMEMLANEFSVEDLSDYGLDFYFSDAVRSVENEDRHDYAVENVDDEKDEATIAKKSSKERECPNCGHKW